VLIYPNPARERISISLSAEAFNQAVSYRIFNMAGQLMAQSNISQPEFVLERSALQNAGIYFIQFTDNNGNMILSRRISIID
jgi:hypothetical protein